MDLRLNSEDRTRVRALPVIYEGKKLNDLKYLIQFNLISIQFQFQFPFHIQFQLINTEGPKSLTKYRV